MKKLLAMLAFSVNMMLVSDICFTAVIHVPVDKPTIQEGIDAAVNGDTVLVADGLYTGDGNRDISFCGKAITVKSEHGAYNCVIDCECTQTNHYCGFKFENGEDELSVLSGFTIMNAYVIHSEGGGAIQVRNCSPKIEECFISNNVAILGGGIMCLNASPLISNCNFLENKATQYGGAIMCTEQSNPVIIECNIKSSIVSTIHGIGVGGGICCRNSSPEIRNCTISNSSNRNSGTVGGGIACIGNSSPSISNTFITFNGDVWHPMWKNGGGIFCSDNSSPILTNCLIFGNEADEGGGLYCESSSYPMIINCTIEKNTAHEYPAVFCDSESGVMMRNSIVWGNLRFEKPDEYGNSTITFSCIQYGYPGLGNIAIDPKFFIDESVNDFDSHLSFDSPCIDSGTDQDVPQLDIEGKMRPLGGGVDMGAYEFIGWPAGIRSYVHMPTHQIEAGNVISVNAKLWNGESNALGGHLFWVILDLHGHLHFAPGFNGIDCYIQDFPPGLSEINVIPPFSWPDGIGSEEGLVWYAALTDPAITKIIGEMGIFDFRWIE